MAGEAAFFLPDGLGADSCAELIMTQRRCVGRGNKKRQLKGGKAKDYRDIPLQKCCSTGSKLVYRVAQKVGEKEQIVKEQGRPDKTAEASFCLGTGPLAPS